MIVQNGNAHGFPFYLFLSLFLSFYYDFFRLSTENGIEPIWTQLLGESSAAQAENADSV